MVPASSLYGRGTIHSQSSGLKSVRKNIRVYVVIIRVTSNYSFLIETWSRVSINFPHFSSASFGEMKNMINGRGSEDAPLLNLHDFA